MPVTLTRSEQMSRIRGRDTEPELMLRKALWTQGFRYRLNQRVLRTRPDLVFSGSRVAVFVDGCQWHGCPDHYVRPRTREDFWAAKLRGSIERDRRQMVALEASGWELLRVWEHDIVVDIDAVVARIVVALRHPNLARVSDWRVVRVEVVDEEKRIERRILTDLRDPSTVREITGRRITAKARAPSSRRAFEP